MIKNIRRGQTRRMKVWRDKLPWQTPVGYGNQSNTLARWYYPQTCKVNNIIWERVHWSITEEREKSISFAHLMTTTTSKSYKQDDRDLREGRGNTADDVVISAVEVVLVILQNPFSEKKQSLLSDEFLLFLCPNVLHLVWN